MRSTIVWLLLCAGLVSTAPANAGLTTAQFAYGLPLEVSGEQAFYELELPLEVYRASLRNDLGDIRVFNAAGQVVPHALRGPTNLTQRQEVVTTVPFFPLAAGVAPLDGDFSLHVERTADGTIVDIQTDSREKQQQGGKTGSYLLDAKGLKQPVETLELFWSTDTIAFLTEVVVEASNDLVAWQPLTTAAVGRLVYENFRLDQNKITLPRTRSRFLRLSWPDGQAMATLAKVLVLTSESSIVERPALKQLLLATEQVSDRRYRVDLQGALPVVAVTIVLAENNGLAAARLYSSTSIKGPMQERWRGLAYTLTTNSITVSNQAISMASTRQRFWELALDASETSPAVAPKLAFDWQPDRLVFLAQGNGPYTLAYGSGVIEPTNFHIDTLLKLSNPSAQESLQPQFVQPGTPFKLGERGVVARQPLPWKQYILWGILSLGVLLIAGMAFSLYRKLRDSELS